MTGSPRDPLLASRQILDSDLSELQEMRALVPPSLAQRRKQFSEVTLTPASADRERRISDFWYEPITGQNLPEGSGLENSATENQTPVEVLEAEAEPSVVQLQVRDSPLTDSFTD